MAAVAFILAGRNFSRRSSISLAPPIVCLIVYLGFAGVSVLWAFSPELSFIRFVQQSMIVISIVLPTITAVRPTDIMRGLFLTFAFAVILNIPFVIEGYQTIVDNVAIGYSGYFLGKNYLGECAAIALLLSLHQLFYRGSRRTRRNLSCDHLHFTPTLRKLQNCDWSCCSCAIPRWGFIAINKTTRVSPAIVLISIVLCYLLFSKLTGFTLNWVSYMLYGDSSFTGRQVIWDYVNTEIAKRRSWDGDISLFGSLALAARASLTLPAG